MNKFIFFIISLMFTMHIDSKDQKQITKPSISLAFIANKTKNQQPVINQETIEYCIETLQACATIQENRALTLEEISLALQALMFLYLAPTNGYSKHIEVSIHNKKLTLPYSEEFISELMGAKNSANSQEQKETTDTQSHDQN